MELKQFRQQMQEILLFPEHRVSRDKRDIMMQQIVTRNGDKKQCR